MSGGGLEVALIFLGMSSLVAVPLAVLLGLPLLAWVARGWLSIKEKELELHSLQVAQKLRDDSLGRLPVWVDTGDADAIIAWARADREMGQLEARN